MELVELHIGIIEMSELIGHTTKGSPIRMMVRDLR